MEVDQALQILGATAQGSRELDAMIAAVIGSAKSDPSGKGTGIWLVPSPKDKRIPYFTSNLQDAYELLRLIAPRHNGGFAWEPGTASAILKMGESDIVQAPTPMIALCITALQAIKLKRALFDLDALG